MAPPALLSLHIHERQTHSPPNSCMPSRAKMRMKRKSRNSSEMMDLILLSSEMTRLRRDAQYLQTTLSINTATERPHTQLQQPVASTAVCSLFISSNCNFSVVMINNYLSVTLCKQLQYPSRSYSFQASAATWN